MAPIPTWAIVSLVSAVSFALGDFMVVKVADQGLISEQTVFMAYMLICAVAIVVYLWWTKTGLGSLDYLQRLCASGGCYSLMGNLLLISFLMLVAYYFHFLALTSAPNPGYANSLIILHVIFLSLLSYFYLGKSLNRRSLVGILMAILGSTIVIRSSS